MDGQVAARPQLIRAMNEQLLLEQLRRAAPLSRPELSRLSGLSKPTVALAIEGLERAGLVHVAGQRTGVRGPAALLYELRPDAGYVLALDVGREYIRGAVGDLSGAVRAKLSRRAPGASARSRVGELAALADELLAAAGAKRRRVVLQTVVGSPGVVDPARDALRMAGNLPGWEQPRVLAELRRLLGPSTAIENDVDMAAVAEQAHGHGRGASTFAFVSVGTGIGMGVVIDGKLHRGAHGGAGEIAYLPIEPDGVDPREVRSRGALEASVSSAAVVRSARAHGLDGNLSARRVFAAAAAGDERARAVVAREAALVAKALASIVAVVDPELIVLGGGIGGAAGFAAAVGGALQQLAPFVPEIRVSALGEDAVVQGCLAAGTELAWERVLRSRTQA
ncbi:MAG TPA: ROK family transcriptional regulator [Gaiellaceae bacterium]|nr:ROK family transcriptional regulator [Gaiellaceae bacterium]